MYHYLSRGRLHGDIFKYDNASSIERVSINLHGTKQKRSNIWSPSIRIFKYKIYLT